MVGEQYRVQTGTPMITPYAARDYSSSFGDTASEVLSQGMELLYANPLHLAANDPALFEYVINVIRGTRP